MPKVKIYELAKELDMPSKDLLDKVVSMGIEAKTHMSAISEIDAISVKNTILRGKSGTETKIVKVAPKQQESPKEEKKVVVKAATNITASPEAKKPQMKTAAQARPNMGQNRPTEGAKQSQARPVGPGQASQLQRDQSNLVQNQNTAQESPNSSQEQVKPVEQSQGSQMQNQELAKNPEVVKEQDSRSSQIKSSGQATQEQSQPQRSEQNQNRPASQPSNSNQLKPNTNQLKPNTNQLRSNTNQQRPNTNQQRPNTNQQRPNTNQLKPNTNQLKPNTNQIKQGTNQARPGGPGATGSQQQKPTSNKDYQKQQHPKGDGKAFVKPVYNAAPLAKKQRPKPQRQKPVLKPVEPEIDLEEMEPGTKIINVPITVAGFADQIEKSTSAIIMSLMKMGIMANINQNLDEEMVVVIGEELGVPIIIGKVQKEVIDEGLDNFEDKEEDLKPRPPIITVMGHVDHGKTSLLDAIRKTNVASGESGGITQHIGASEVSLKGQKIVFLDTPGHEAFTAMRARGAHTTDIAILVVAADDSVKPQTIESISHAKAAGVPIIVAVNKMDKPGANPDKVKQDLAENGVLIEEWGGDTICVHVSAKTGEGIVNLLEMVLLQAEVLELRANPNRLAIGTVIEARLDTARGTVASLLVLNGTLKAGMSIVAGTCSGKIKVMNNHKGDIIRKAGPATAVEILGLSDIPQAGDEFYAIKEDKLAREIAENRRVKLREEVMARNSSTTLEQLFSKMEAGEIKDLNLIIKGDVQGSVGALTSSIEKLKNENIMVKIIYAGVGTVTESDIMLANTSGAIIIAFNVRPSTAISTMAEREGVEIRTYRVIYNVIDEVEAAMKGMLDPVFKEVVLGKIEVRETFKVPGIGLIAGAYVLEGKVERNAEIRLVRDGIVVHEGKISSLKRFKDDVKEVAHGYECGIGIENYNDLKENDIIEAFKMEEVERK